MCVLSSFFELHPSLLLVRGVLCFSLLLSLPLPWAVLRCVLSLQGLVVLAPLGCLLLGMLWWCRGLTGVLYPPAPLAAGCSVGGEQGALTVPFAALPTLLVLLGWLAGEAAPAR